MVEYNVKMIERYLGVHKISREEFCDICKVPRDTVDRFYAKDGSIFSETILKVVEILMVRVDDFLNM